MIAWESSLPIEDESPEAMNHIDLNHIFAKIKRVAIIPDKSGREGNAETTIIYSTKTIKKID